MRDFILTFPDEPTAIAALPIYRVEYEDGEHWEWCRTIIPSATRWIMRPSYDAETEITTPGETVPGWHCIIRTESLPEAAQPYLVTEDTDVEPVPAGGLLKPQVPQSVSALQGMRAIKQAGLVEAFIAWKSSLDSITHFEELAFFDKAQTWERANPVFQGAAAALELTDAQLDELFMLAETL